MLISCISLKESWGLWGKGALGPWLFPTRVEFKPLAELEEGRESVDPGSKTTD